MILVPKLMYGNLAVGNNSAVGEAASRFLPGKAGRRTRREGTVRPRDSTSGRDSLRLEWGEGMAVINIYSEYDFLHDLVNDVVGV